MHCLILPQGADFNLQMFGFIVESPPPSPPEKKKIKLKILGLSLPSPLMFLLTFISQEITNLPPLVCFLTYGHDEPFIEP